MIDLESFPAPSLNRTPLLLWLIFGLVDHRRLMDRERFAQIIDQAKVEYATIVGPVPPKITNVMGADTKYLGPLGRLASFMATERAERGDLTASYCESAIWGGYGDALRVGTLLGNGALEHGDAANWLALMAWVAASRSRALFSVINPVRHRIKSGTFYRFFASAMARGMVLGRPGP